MSLATLKKKTAHKYNNNSVNRTFSINGTHRNQGYIGQTSLSRTLIHTPKKNDVAQGHGSCCGMYPVQNIKNSSICTTEKSNVVKSSVLSSRGMLAKRNRWVKRPAPFSSTKPSDSINQNTSGDYIVYKRKNAIKTEFNCFMKKYILTFQYVPVISNNLNNNSAPIELYINGKLMDSISFNINDNDDGIQDGVYTYNLNGKLYGFEPNQQYIEREITFYESNGTLDINFQGSGTFWYRTGIAKLKLNGKSIISSYRMHIGPGFVSKTRPIGEGPNGVVYNYHFGNSLNGASPTSDNPFIVINGYTSSSLVERPDHRNQSESASFLGSEFPEMLITSKTSIQGSDCCDKTVQMEYSLGAISQGDYIFQRIADCANLDISYIEYHTNSGSTFNTC